MSDEQIQDQIDTNLIGSIQVIRAVLPHLRSQGGGRILQVSSEGGQVTYPNFSLYHATKWGIEGFVETVAKEVAPFGIELTIVEPGPTKTDFGKGLVAPQPMADRPRCPDPFPIQLPGTTAALLNRNISSPDVSNPLDERHIDADKEPDWSKF